MSILLQRINLKNLLMPFFIHAVFSRLYYQLFLVVVSPMN